MDTSVLPSLASARLESCQDTFTSQETLVGSGYNMAGKEELAEFRCLLSC